MEQSASLKEVDYEKTRDYILHVATQKTQMGNPGSDPMEIGGITDSLGLNQTFPGYEYDGVNWSFVGFGNQNQGNWNPNSGNQWPPAQAEQRPNPHQSSAYRLWRLTLAELHLERPDLREAESPEHWDAHTQRDQRLSLR